MPCWLTNTQATLQRLMISCLCELYLTWHIIYLDDIIDFSQSPEGHLRLSAVFDKLRAAGLKINPSKCKLLRKLTKFLDNVVSSEGISTDPNNNQAVIEWPRLTTVTEVILFLGFVSHYRSFIPNFFKVVKPLSQFLFSKFEWYFKPKEKNQSVLGIGTTESL